METGQGNEKKICVYDVGSTYTKLSVFSLGKEGLKYLGRSQAPTTVDDIIVGLQNVKYQLAINEEICDDPQGLTLATSSAAGGLRMVAMGYMPRVTAKAAKEVAMTAGARVLEIVSFEDPPDYKVEVLREINPDIILLAGGTDGGDQESMLQNALVIVESKINAVVIIAGNVEAQSQVEGILNAHHLKTTRVANVMPTIHELNVKPARAAIHEQFISQITQAKGLGKLVETVSNNKVIPTPGAVLMGSELLALGTYQSEGMGDILVIDIGGATTDVHSILASLKEIPNEEKGLVVNNEKQTSYRTVEGNLGLRVSAMGIVETVGPGSILTKIGLEGQDQETEITKYANFLENNPDHIAVNQKEKLFDEGLAILAVEIALKRHAGFLAKDYDPLMGIAPGTPIGRDLRKVKYVIGIGGIFTHSSKERAERIIKRALENPGVSLLPKTPEIIIDNNYLLYALGVLGQIYPEETLKFGKEYFFSGIC
ncbi:MAG: glutamate mutase L [Dehalobacterium sp.]